MIEEEDLVQIITIDFETYYDKKYSLSKLTTEEYINDTRFQVIGVGVKVNANKAEWFSGTHDEIYEWLHQFDWEHSCATAHNAMFDAAILSWHFDIRPPRWTDTLSLARAVDGVHVSNSLKAACERWKIGKKGTEVVDALGKRREDFTPEDLAQYGEYCKNDCELTIHLFAEMYREDIDDEEYEAISTTIKMFSEPVLRLDTDLLKNHLAEIIKTKKELMEKAKSNAEILQSNPKFAEALKELGVLPPMKTSARTGKETFAFAKSDKGLNDLMEHDNPKVQALVAARLGVKSTLEETRTQRLIDIAERIGALPVPLKYHAAHTGRWGGSDKVNLQNLPSRGNNVIKRAIIAPKGHTLIDADSSQIEARVLAWLSGQDDLVQAFANKEDVYKIMAGSIYDKAPEDVTKEERFVGKTTILGCGYGMGAERFRNQLRNFGVDIELELAQKIIDTYRNKYDKIKQLWKDGQHCLQTIIWKKESTFGVRSDAVFLGESGFVLPNNVLLEYPNLKQEQGNFTYRARRMEVRIYGGKVVENICQAVARCIIACQMGWISEHYKVALTVHDSLVCVVKDEEVEEARQFIEECMREEPEWAKGLPLDCESGIGKSYGECG
jgi:DNA polymerase I-like protein with 3'-5' exonuclease and polymerase domains